MSIPTATRSPTRVLSAVCLFASQAGNAEVRVVCVPLRLFLKSGCVHRRAATPGRGTARWASPPGFARCPCSHARWTTASLPGGSPTRLDRVQVNRLHLLVVLPQRAQRAIEEARLPQPSHLPPRTVDPLRRTVLDGLHHSGDGERIGWTKEWRASGRVGIPRR
jgi:hypothetical protein